MRQFVIAASQFVHEKCAAEVCVTRGFRHRWSVTKGVYESRVCDEAGRAPTFEAREGAAHVRIESEELVLSFLRARDFGAERKPQCGAVTFIQRFGSALNLKMRS